jgi:hypothetical protein
MNQERIGLHIINAPADYRILSKHRWLTIEVAGVPLSICSRCSSTVPKTKENRFHVYYVSG